MQQLEKQMNYLWPSSQHLGFSSGVYECRPRLLDARVLAQRSQAAAFSRFIKIVLGSGPTMIEAFQRIIGAADLFAKTISNPNMYGNYPKDPEVDFDDLPHFAHSLFAGFPTCALGLCSEGDFAR
jgi:hypothetical protein